MRFKKQDIFLLHRILINIAFIIYFLMMYFRKKANLLFLKKPLYFFKIFFLLYLIGVFIFTIYNFVVNKPAKKYQKKWITIFLLDSFTMLLFSILILINL